MNDHSQEQEHEQLSEQGLARREALLSTLQERVVVEGRRRRRRRAAGRIAVGGVGLAAIAIVVGILMNQPSGSRSAGPRIASGPVESPGVPSSEGGRDFADADADVAADGPLIARVETDASVVDRFRVDRRARVSEFAISDEALLDSLAAMGRPAGMVKSEGRVWLTASVTDAEIGQRDRGADG